MGRSGLSDGILPRCRRDAVAKQARQPALGENTPTLTHLRSHPTRRTAFEQRMNQRNVLTDNSARAGLGRRTADSNHNRSPLGSRSSPKPVRNPPPTSAQSSQGGIRAGGGRGAVLGEQDGGRCVAQVWSEEASQDGGGAARFLSAGGAEADHLALAPRSRARRLNHQTAGPTSPLSTPSYYTTPTLIPHAVCHPFHPRCALAQGEPSPAVQVLDVHG